MASVQTQLASAVLTAGITGNDLDIDPKAILKTALTAGANQYALDQYGASSIDADGLKTTTYNSEIDFSTNLQNGLQNTVITTAVSTAINGGSLADNLESNLANSVLTTVTAKGANIIGTNKANLGEIGHKVAHAALGCAGAKIQGKDCSSGAVGAVSGEIIAEQLGKNADLSDENVVAISRIGTGIIAQGLGKDVEVADKAGVNAVENNALANGAVLLTVAAVAELIDKGVTTYDAWQLKKALDEGRNEDAKALAVVIGVGVITEVIPGNKIIQKVVSGIKKRKGSAGIDGDAVQPPKNQTLPAFPGVKKSPRKKNGRDRYEDKKNIYEWDSKKGAFEKYRKSNGKHLGEFDHITGKQTGKAISNRRLKK
jgi:hypothetical protein